VTRGHHREAFDQVEVAGQLRLAEGGPALLDVLLGDRPVNLVQVDCVAASSRSNGGA
jgi:hypothetical protein